MVHTLVRLQRMISTPHDDQSFGHFSFTMTQDSCSISTHSGSTNGRHRMVLVWPPNTWVYRPVLRSHILTVRSVVEPLTRMSLLAARPHTPPSWPWRRRMSSPVGGEYMGIQWSSEITAPIVRSPAKSWREMKGLA